MHSQSLVSAQSLDACLSQRVHASSQTQQRCLTVDLGHNGHRLESNFDPRQTYRASVEQWQQSCAAV